jgi:hypothetical protein
MALDWFHMQLHTGGWLWHLYLHESAFISLVAFLYLRVSHCFPLTSTIMYSNPHVRQPVQSEGDSFQVSESLGRLRLDSPADDNTNPSTPPKSTLPSTQLNVSISDEALQALGEELEPNIQSSYDNTRLQRSLKYVWVAVHNALEDDPDLSTCRASQKEFLQNLKERGEQQFFDLLRDVAERKSWRDLLQSSKSFHSSDHRLSSSPFCLQACLLSKFPQKKEILPN